MRNILFRTTLIFSLLLLASFRQLTASGTITIAAAADLHFAMDDLINEFNKTNPGIRVNVIYGSSGNLYQQIVNSASFHLYFSADMSYARKLDSLHLAAGRPKLYATGHLVLWSSTLDVSKGIKVLSSPSVKKIAIANPAVAPYGKRAVECLKYYHLFEQLQDKIVKGENVSQAAQFVLTGNADAGLIALSLALSPEMSSKGKYFLLDDASYSLQEQGFVVIKGAENNPDVKKFTAFLETAAARKIFMKYGFRLPGEK